MKVDANSRLVGVLKLIDEEIARAYCVAFGKMGDPNGDDRPEWPLHDPSANRMTNFTDDGVVIGQTHSGRGSTSGRRCLTRVTERRLACLGVGFGVTRNSRRPF